MKTRDYTNRIRSQHGAALGAVMIFCLLIMIVSAAIFGTIGVSQRVNRSSRLLTQAREGAEGALAFATAELNRRAASYATITESPLSGYTLSATNKDYLAGVTTNNNLLSTSLEVKPGSFSSTITTMTLENNDLVYNNDGSQGLTVGVRTGEIFAKASAKDSISGAVTTSYVAGNIQMREQAWFNYGFFYNMDMEFFPGPRMDVYGPIHTNADLYLAGATSDSGNPNTVTTAKTANFYKKVTAAGHIYRGLKYCISSRNADGTVAGFVKKTSWDSADTNGGQGPGDVWCTNGTTLVKMANNNDCLGTLTSPTANISTWQTQEATTWSRYVMDSSLNIGPFTPPALPLYVPEDYSTGSTTELRNHGYAMIEPQLPNTDGDRYYGRKSADVENLKFSALAGLTIVVDDLDRLHASDSTIPDVAKAADQGYAIPWKLVWYKGATTASIPVNKENLPLRDSTTGLPVIMDTIDPFAKNDEIDKVVDSSVTVTMKRNLKALLRDCIVVVPYRDNGGTTTQCGTGTISVSITSWPTGTAANSDYSFNPNSSAATYTRYNQPAGRWPGIPTGSATSPSGPHSPTAYAYTSNGGTYFPYTLTRDQLPSLAAPIDKSYNWIVSGNADASAGGTAKYPKTSSAATGSPNTSVAGIYSGLYDRRQGFNGTLSMTAGTNYNNGLKGAMHVVYIDLQKLDWILNQRELWIKPGTTDLIYDKDVSYTNIIYVDLPSDAQDATRHGTATGVPKTEPDKICHAARPTATKPGYCVLLQNGGRLPRVAYSDTLRTPGFTLATNGPLYIKGNYNADGDSSTGTSQISDQGSTTTNWYSAANPDAEMPALVAADCVAFLSANFNTKTSNVSCVAGNTTATINDGYGVATTTATSGNFMEISTAIVTGLTPTIPDIYVNNTNQYSGSVNNLPRFLENLGSITVRYRGSMAALYDCEICTSRFIQNSHGYWFTPPTRDWGYHQYLAAGRYPPGTPVLRTTRLMSLRDIGLTEYTAGPIQP